MKYKKWDVMDYLVDNESIAGFINTVIKDEPELLPVAIGDVVRAYGINEMSKKTGIKRESLYKAFSNKGNPTYKTLQALLNGLGFELSIKQKIQAKA
jgi:probable addiction module antidote protein